MLEVSMLTGHVNVRTRREMKRMAAALSENSGGSSVRMEETAIQVVCDQDGNLTIAPDVQLTKERYIVVCFKNEELFEGEQAGENVGSTFDLAALWPDGLPAGVSYYLLRNQTGRDINVVLGTAPQLRPADTIVKAGGCREASLYAGEARSVLTISDDLIDVEA